MKSARYVTLFVFLIGAWILSACSSLVAQGQDFGSTATPLTPPDQVSSPQPTPTEIFTNAEPTPANYGWKSYTSDIYDYTVSYPGNWQVAVDTQAASGSQNQPENVTFSPVAGGLPSITIYALTGLPPFTGYEECQPNLVVRGLDACRISQPAGQDPASELIVFHNGEQFFQIAFQYEAQEDLAVFDQFMISFQFTKEVNNGSTAPVLKSYASKEYGFEVKYQASWTVNQEIVGKHGDGTNYESVTFTPASTKILANIAIYALTGSAPFSGYENCEKNLVFRNLNACRISLPASGQIPATELLLFQNGDAHFQIAMQYFDQSALETFDQFLMSFEFFNASDAEQPGGATPTAPAEGTNCNLAQFVEDVTVSNGATMKPGEFFMKKWRLKNAGTCTWSQGYHLVFSSGAEMNGPAFVSLPEVVAPGKIVDALVNLKAPDAPGEYSGYWKLAAPDGTQFGAGSDGQDAFLVKINVVAQPTDTPGMVRVNFFEGATSAQVASELSVGETKTYVLNVAAGQALLAKVDSATQNILLRIYGLGDGQVLLENSMGAGQNHWEGIVPSSQDYAIEVINRDETSRFTLDLTVPEEVVIPFQPGSISDSLHFSLQPGETHTFRWNIAGGQTVNLKLTPEDGSACLAFAGLQDGKVYLDEAVCKSSWTGEVTSSQDYLIRVVSQSSANAKLTLDVSINTY